MSKDSSAMSRYLTTIGRCPLLTADQEIQLGRTIQEWMQLRGAKPEPEDYTDAERRLAKHGKRAQDKMVKANLRLVVTVAKKYATKVKCLELLDLVQEGNLGLVRATELFDPGRGYKFSTYSYWWIRQAVTRAIIQSDRTIRIPLHTQEVLQKVKKEMRLAEALTGQVPSVKELAERTGYAEEKVRYCLSLYPDAISLDKSGPADDSNCKLLDLVVDPQSLDEVEDELIFERELLSDAINSLSELDRAMIERRNGLNSCEPTSFKALGDELGVSRERARQRHDNALNRLRHYIYAANYFATAS